MFVDIGAWDDDLTMEDKTEALSSNDQRLARVLKAAGGDFEEGGSTNLTASTAQVENL